MLKDIMEVAVAFFIAWLFYQGLAFAIGTSMPIVSVASESMEPILHKGDLSFVIGPDNLKTGDIIIYNPRPGCFNVQHTIVHRIIDITEDGKLITKGDNNPTQDKCPVDVSEVHGKVVFAFPLLGYPRVFIYDIFRI